MESILLFCVYFSVACWYATEKGWMDSAHIPTHIPTSAPALTIAVEDPSEGLVALADSQSVESLIGVEATLEPVDLYATATDELSQSDIEEWLANETWKPGIPIEGIEPVHLPIHVVEMVGKIPAGVGFQKTARSKQKHTN